MMKMSVWLGILGREGDSNVYVGYVTSYNCLHHERSVCVCVYVCVHVPASVCVCVIVGPKT